MVKNKTLPNILTKDPAPGFSSSCIIESVSLGFSQIQTPWGQLLCWGFCFFLILLCLPKAKNHHFYFYGSFPYPAGTTVSCRWHWGSLRHQRVKILSCQSCQIFLSLVVQASEPCSCQNSTFSSKRGKIIPLFYVTLYYRGFHFTLSYH